MDKKALKKAVINTIIMIFLGCAIIGATIVYNRNYKKKSKGKVLKTGSLHLNEWHFLEKTIFVK